MLVEVTLCGYTSEWEFSGAGKFQNWAMNSPWQHEGGLCVVRISAEAPFDSFLRAASKTIRGINGADRPVSIRRIECGGINGTPFQALLSALELAPSLSIFEARDSIRIRLLDRPTAFLFMESALVSPGKWEELVNLIEHYRKSSVPICAIIFDKRAITYSEPVCDFTVGRCVHHVFSPNILFQQQSLWMAYAHLRIYWESAGNLGHALALSKLVESISPEDDERFEACLQQYSFSMLVHPSFSVLKKMVSDIDLGVRSPASTIHELVENKLMWIPPGTQSPRVVPWAARALLRNTQLSGREVGNLRHSLVCSPLAAEILALCLQSEQDVRSRLHGKGDLIKLADKSRAIENHAKYIAGMDDAIAYPNAHPSPPSRPDDVWAFASLGEVLHCSPGAAVAPLDRSILRLRNGIAHGHYVGWHQVKVALKQLQRSTVLY